MAKIWYALKNNYRHLRVGKLPTQLLGPQYKRSRNRIEIDITYRCNLQCKNCNRSIAQAPENLDISIKEIAKFVETSLRRSLRWRRIRILGGEPTLHPDFLEIVDLLRSYRAKGNRCSIEVVTNGYGSFVNDQLDQLPSDIFIENSRKKSDLQASFRPFSMAPIDDPEHINASFSNGCEIMSKCGLGLTPLGYYPCAIAGGIDRITRMDLGKEHLPSDADDMADVLEHACRLCGRFKDGHYLPEAVTCPLKEELVSKTWLGLYKAWNDKCKVMANASEQ